MSNVLKLSEILAKEIIVKSNLPGTDFVINPYIGCTHGCIYCYAEFMKKFTNHHEAWGKFLDVKINAPELIRKTNYEEKSIFISSVTDPYQPLESKYKITRRLLEKLIDKQPTIEILTKSRLITRDIDILKKFKKISIGISLSTLNEKYSKILEPYASLPKLRLAALKECKEAGLVTYIFLSPIFPYITEIEEIIAESIHFIDYYMFENLNIRPTNNKKIFTFIKETCPALLNKYKDIFLNKEGNRFWDALEKDIIRLGEKYDKTVKICFHHGGFKK